MYASSNLRPRERAGAMAAVIAIHAGLAFALLNLSGTIDERDLQDALRIIDIREVPPPEPLVIEQPEPEQDKRKEGAAAPKNIESQASPVVAPKPKVVIPVQNPVVAAPVPKQGSDPSQGAAPVPGPGTGAGGAGTGTGSGGSGSGPGGGGGGGEGTRPSLVSPVLTGRDYPSSLLRMWPRGARVLVAVRVQINGRATDCKINVSSGVPGIDMETCRLVESRLRFRPARNARGEPYVAWYGYGQNPVNF
jgi:protein TonB